MPSEYVRVKLGDLIRVKHGFAFKGEHFVDEPSSHVLVTPGNFAIGGGFQDTKMKFYRGPVPEEYILKPGDLVVTMTDLSRTADTLGFGAVVPQSAQRVYLHNQRIGLIELLQPSKVSKAWLHYLMRTSEYRTWVVGSATGSTVKHTSPSRICDFEFDLPPIAVQKEAAATLDALEGRISLLRQTNATLESIAQALFKSWFVDFDPVRAKAEGREPEGMDAATAALFPAEFEESALGLIPKGWTVRSLDSFATYLNGLALQKYPAESEDEYLPVIKIAQLRAGHTNGSDRASARLKPEYVVRDGDVLFSWSGSLEVEFWCGGEGALNQHLFKVTSSEVPKWFYYLATKHFLPGFREIAAHKATTMGHIQRGHLTASRLALPPAPVIRALSSVMGPLLERRINGALQARELAAVRDALLPRLISGRLRLPEAMEAAEAAVA